MATTLLVDDDVGIRRLTRHFLEEAGHIVVEAADVRLALLLALDVVQPDLIVTDIILPETGGIEAIGELRARCPGTPVLAATGGGRTGSTSFSEAAAAFGAEASLANPYKSHELLETVNRLLAEGRSAD